MGKKGDLSNFELGMVVGAVGVMVWGMFSWHTLGPLVPIGHRLNATAYEHCF